MRTTLVRRVLAVALVSATLAGGAIGGGIGISTPPEPAPPESPQLGQFLQLFYPYRPTLTPQAHRDLEFLWSDTYRIMRGDTQGFTTTDGNTLNQFGKSLCEEVKNPFGASYSDIRLVHDYFCPGDAPYDPNGLIGFRLPSTPGYGDPDKSHADVYLFVPGEQGQRGGSTPSQFTTAKEDLSTGHPEVYDSVLTANALMFNGPLADRSLPQDSTGDETGTGWAAPDRAANEGFSHEFQHLLVDNKTRLALATNEIFSSGAEALAGFDPNDPPINDVPYTWSLISLDKNAFSDPLYGGCQDLWRVGQNYQAFRLFSAYLLYNFRGSDTIPTFATANGFKDDLLYKWVRGPGLGNSNFRTLLDLERYLSDDACGTCAAKTYFHTGTGPSDTLSRHDRLQLLLHNWRVANYVNNSFLAEGQFGYPPQFGFLPSRDIGTWRSIDGCGRRNDIVAIPPVATLSGSGVAREMTAAKARTFVVSAGDTVSYPMRLMPFGAEYWIIRSDASLASAAHDLIVTVAAESIMRSGEQHPSEDARLVASVVGYTGAPDSLWNHPELAVVTSAMGPRWVDLDSLSAPLRFELPGFGTTYKAAIVVISLGDGLSEVFSTLQYVAGRPVLWSVPFRLDAEVRTAPYQTPNPQAVAQTASTLEDQPTWSPAGDEIGFTRYDGATGYTRIYRRKLDGSAMSPLFSTSVPHNQAHPDWSPRGDLVAFEQDSTYNRRDLWLYNLATQARTRLGTPVGWAFSPAFQPNGQGLAYLRYYQLDWISPGSGIVPNYRYELRRIAIDGSGDTLVVGPTTLYPTAPRWSPDGSLIYFTSGDSLYTVRVADGVVTQVTGFDYGATTCDPHLGATRLALEQSGQLAYFGDSEEVALPFRRLALLNRTTGNRQPVFYRSSTSFFNPRWSFDGTRITYSSNQNNPNDRDVFVGQVSYDHPPVLVANVEDFQVVEGSLAQRTIHAIDADGEALTYVGTYLPPGATLDPTTGAFQWQVPANTQGAVYYVVFRALDPSWGVANRVVRINVIESGGCPFADTWTAAGWQAENSILGRSLSGTLGLDSYRLKATPEVEDGRYRVRLRESEAEATTLDQVRLAVVDHAPDQRAWPLGERVVLGTRVPPYRVTTQQGKDITSLVNGSGTGYFVGSPGDTVLIELVKPGSAVAPEQAGSGEGGLDPFEDDDGGKDGASGGGGYRASVPGGDPATTDALVLSSTGILIQGQNGDGTWSTIRRRYPRENNDQFMVDTLDQGPVRMVFVGRHRLNYVGRVVPTGAVTPQPLELLAVRHSRLGEVGKALLGASDATISLLPGDTLGLEFAATPVPAGMVRDFFLLAKGVYTTAAASLASRVAPTSSLPMAYALLQNRPNPFTGGTVIDFELPRAERVRLEVFDLAGRRVRMLADQSYAPGRWSAEWDRRDGGGSVARPGVYLYRLRAGAFHAERKMVLMP